MQAVSGRPAIWATAQYLSFAAGVEPIDIDVTIEVAGHNTTQARCVLSRDGTEILTTHAALGQRPSEFDAAWTSMPAVPPPAQCSPYRFFSSRDGGIGSMVHMRLAEGRQIAEIDESSQPGSGTFRLWLRCWSGQRPVTVADLAFIGDFMPLGFADAMGAPFAGNSLDNTVRVGHSGSSEWILLDIQVQQIANGFGYGRASLWAEDGTLLGDVSQSVVLRRHTALRAKRGAAFLTDGATGRDHRRVQIGWPRPV